MKQMGFINTSAHSYLELRFPILEDAMNIRNVNKTTYFYWKNWEALIDKRQNGANYDEYVFRIEQPAFFSRIIPTLVSLGVSIQCIDEVPTEMNYEIFYYPMEMLI